MKTYFIKKYLTDINSLFQVEDLSLLFIHIHHLLNEFRPHQARETLRVMMEVQKRQRIETRERFEKHLEKVSSLAKELLFLTFNWLTIDKFLKCFNGIP